MVDETRLGLPTHNGGIYDVRASRFQPAMAKSSRSERFLSADALDAESGVRKGNLVGAIRSDLLRPIRPLRKAIGLNAKRSPRRPRGLDGHVIFSCAPIVRPLRLWGCMIPSVDSCPGLRRRLFAPSTAIGELLV